MICILMAIKTTLEQLEEVQAAISKVMTGQDTSWGDKRVKLADLEMLQKREEYLLKKYYGETGTTRGFPAFNTGIMRRG
jgi:hypothetical protein